MKGIEQLYRSLLEPSEALIADIKKTEGDILVLGAGGKMGPALTLLAKAAIEKAGIQKKVMAASRFSEPGLRQQLEKQGIETHAVDLLEDKALEALPQVENVLYLAGQKFGTTGKEWLTWAMNAYLPGRVVQQYRNARIVVFSTGNVYPLSPVSLGGVSEDQPVGPVGEYAQSCLGRERLFQYGASKYSTPLFIYRLNYANDVSYGVLLEIAKAVYAGKSIDLSMGYVNVIWQGDANEMAIRSLLHCSTPAKIVNIAGPETTPVRWIAEEFGKLFEKKPVFVNDEQPTALLSNAAESFRLFGYPRVTLKQMIVLLAEWIKQGGKTINKPTHFQEREGQF
ncbi:MAG: NAD(P)-dependent oxidoreductase [Chitinophagaceae bacterium]|nr:NAD(P)-dependent oxidoreductase [Chitinophagaceae bacterium]